MSSPSITGVQLSGVLGPAAAGLRALPRHLGRGAVVAGRSWLAEDFDVVGLGPARARRNRRHRRRVHDGRARVRGAVLVEGVLDERGEPGGSFDYAGDSVGGAVGLQLLLDHPERVRGGRPALHRRPDRRRRRCGRAGRPVRGSGTGRWWTASARALVRARVRRPSSPRSPPRCCTRCRTTDRSATRWPARRWPPSTYGTGSDEITAPVARGRRGVRRRHAGRRDPRRSPRRRRRPPGRAGRVAHLAPAEAPERVAVPIRERRRHPADDPPPSLSGATRAWPYAGRCSATRTWTAPPPPPPT